LEQPKLLDGLYRLSLWFGEGAADYFAARDCMTFQVTGMTKLRQQPTSAVGCVSPMCQWDLQEGACFAQSFNGAMIFRGNANN
jgi:hypothetical protein